MSHPSVMHLIIPMSNTSMIPYISLDQYLNPNSYTIPNMQNMRFFCCSVYILIVSLDVRVSNDNDFNSYRKNHDFRHKLWQVQPKVILLVKCVGLKSRMLHTNAPFRFWKRIMKVFIFLIKTWTSLPKHINPIFNFFLHWFSVMIFLF